MEGNGHVLTWENPCKHGTVTRNGELSSGGISREHGYRVFAATNGFHRLQRVLDCAVATGVCLQRQQQYASLQGFYGACRDRTGDLRLAKPALSQLS